MGRRSESGVTARWLVVHLPAFRLERCGFSFDDLAGLIAEERNALRVICATPAASAEGIQPGTTAAEARALVPEIELIPLDREGEAADRRELLRSFGRLSDRVAALGDDDILLEVSRTAHIFGGEEGVVGAALALAEEFGHRARVVLADEAIGAAAVARTGLRALGEAGRVIPRGALAGELADLPVAALGPSPALREALRTVGIRKVGDLVRLDPASVAGRWGEEAAHLTRIGRGESVGVPGPPARDEGPIALSAPLAGATTLSEVAFALPSTIGRLVQELAARDLAVIRLRVLLRLERTADARGPTLGLVQVPVRAGRPTRDPIRLRRLIQSRLEAVRLSAPVSELVIEVAESAPALGWQPGLIDRTEATEPLPELLARLTDTLGEAAVFAPGVVDRWRPETSWEPRLFPAAPAIRPVGVGHALVADPVEAQDQWVRAVVRRPRPSLLLPLPQRIEMRPGDPLAVRLGESWVAVTHLEGPERLQGEWWRIGESLDREYWVATLGHSVAWLFREQMRWYLHGWFD